MATASIPRPRPRTNLRWWLAHPAFTEDFGITDVVEFGYLSNGFAWTYAILQTPIRVFSRPLRGRDNRPCRRIPAEHRVLHTVASGSWHIFTCARPRSRSRRSWGLAIAGATTVTDPRTATIWFSIAPAGAVLADIFLLGKIEPIPGRA